jgi:hypothetical protein
MVLELLLCILNSKRVIRVRATTRLTRVLQKSWRWRLTFDNRRDLFKLMSDNISFANFALFWFARWMKAWIGNIHRVIDILGYFQLHLRLLGDLSIVAAIFCEVFRLDTLDSVLIALDKWMRFLKILQLVANLRFKDLFSCLSVNCLLWFPGFLSIWYWRYLLAEDLFLLINGF